MQTNAYTEDFEMAIMDTSSPLILSFDHRDCGIKCKEWKDHVNQSIPPHVRHIVTDVDMMHEFDALSEITDTQSIFELPNGIFLHGDLMVPFNRHNTPEGIKRWIDDALFGMNSTVYLGLDIETYRNRFNGSVEIVSNTPLYWESMKKLTSIGFAYCGFNVDPLYFVRSVFGIHHVFDDARHIFHGLIDTILPYSKIKQYDVTEIIAHYTNREVHIVHAGALPDWWVSFANLYTSTLFVHYQPHEVDLPSPSVTIYNRSVIYQRNSTDIETIRWYHDVLHGRAIPHHRISAMPENILSTTHEVTGDTLSTFLRVHENMYLTLYDDNDETVCDDFINELNETMSTGEANVYARFHMGLNDHEALDEQARAGFIIHFINGTRKRVIRCIK